jgi:hypothetical protein
LPQVGISNEYILTHDDILYVYDLIITFYKFVMARSASLPQGAGVVEIKGNILADPTQYDYLVHQCDCLTTRATGFAELIVIHLGPDYDIYQTRQLISYTETLDPEVRKHLAITEDRAWPGSIRLMIGKKYKHLKVVPLFGQWAPGAVDSKWPALYPPFKRGEKETQFNRETWFKYGLLSLESDAVDGSRVAFPMNIGCGYAGGDWEKYRTMIDAFAERVTPRGIRVFIYNSMT